MSADPRTLLSARGVSCRYGRHWALRDVAFSLAAGDKVALVGPNGSGKSTLMHLVAGLLECDEGHLSLWRHRPRSRHARQRVGFLPEDNPLPEGFRVMEYLDDRRRRYGTQAALVDEAVERLDLGDWRRRLIRELSHGTRRRVGLAAIWVTGAPFLVLDEPTSGLDPLQIRLVRSWLQSVDRTVLVSTHILSDAAAICSRYLLLANGRLAASGPVAGLEAAFREHIG